MNELRTDEDKVKEVTKRLDALKKVRQPFEGDIDTTISYVNHGILKISDTNTSRGQRTGIEVYDDTAIRANNLRADGLHGYLFSPGWFKLTLPNTVDFPRWSAMRAMSGKRLDEMPDVAKWLTDAQEASYAAFAASNWYQQTPEIFRMSGAIGTVPVEVEKDLVADRICFTATHIRECYISRDRFGKVDGMWHVYDITLNSLVEKFGLKKMNEAKPGFEDRWKNSPYDEETVIHATFKRINREPGKKDNKNKPYASFWVFNNKLLLESGYDYFPWIVHDERRNANEMYSRSPGYEALVAILLANQMGKTNLIAGQTAAEPPYAVLEGLRGQLFTGPKGRTYLQRMEDRPQAMQDALRGMPFALEFQERVDRSVNEYFHTDIFMMMNRIAVENKNITATQVVEMSGEKAAVMSPITERIEHGLFQDAVDLVFSFEQEAGRIGPPPDIVLEMGITKIDTDYYGPLSQARRRFYKVQGFRAGVEDVSALASISPTVLDNYDWDKIARAATKESFSADYMLDEKIVKAIRDSRAQQIAEQQQAAMVLEAAKVAPGLGKQIEGGSPLSVLTGGGEQ